MSSCSHCRCTWCAGKSSSHIHCPTEATPLTAKFVAEPSMPSTYSMMVVRYSTGMRLKKPSDSVTFQENNQPSYVNRSCGSKMNSFWRLGQTTVKFTYSMRRIPVSKNFPMDPAVNILFCRPMIILTVNQIRQYRPWRAAKRQGNGCWRLRQWRAMEWYAFGRRIDEGPPTPTKSFV
jgi:hypothetical protein